MPRPWSVTTLYRRLNEFLDEHDEISEQSDVGYLLEVMKDDIVESVTNG